MELKGRTVLVTGGAKRIGRSIALAFAREGCDILLHHHTSEDAAQAAAAEVRGHGVSCIVLRADLSEPSEIDAMFSRHAELLRTDILVNSASVFFKTPTGSVDRKIWERFFRVNLEAPFDLAGRIGGELLRAGREGVIINITDRYARHPVSGYLPYCASKAALENITRSLAADLAPLVRVNAVAPGAILFPEGSKEEDMKRVLKSVPLRRAGSPEDIAAACVFLSQNGFINGITLTVDGGASLGLIN